MGLECDFCKKQIFGAAFYDNTRKVHLHLECDSLISKINSGNFSVEEIKAYADKVKEAHNDS